MRKVLSIIVLFICQVSTAQDVQYEKDWIDLWQRGTVSIGEIRYDTISSQSSQKVIPYYYIIGTGVIFYIKIDKIAIPVVVTAKHVIEQEGKKYPDTIRVRFSWHDDKSVYQHFGVSVPLRYEGKQNWFSLSDSDVDLACFPLLANDYSIRDSLKMIPYSLFTTNSSLYEGEDVFVLGYPGSVGKTYWTRGLVRRGVIAWLPKENIQTQKFLIDCPVYPGNSGGPVFSKSKTGIVTHDTVSASSHLEKFLGIVVERRLNYNRVQTFTQGKANPIKDINGLFAWSSESIGVAVVEPAEKVYKLLKLVEEIANRKE